MNIDQEIQNFNRVKNIVIQKLIEEDLIDETDGNEFIERCHVMVYRGNWFTNWFKKHMPLKDENDYYIRIIELSDREDDIDKIIRKSLNS